MLLRDRRHSAIEPAGSCTLRARARAGRLQPRPLPADHAAAVRGFRPDRRRHPDHHAQVGGGGLRAGRRRAAVRHLPLPRQAGRPRAGRRCTATPRSRSSGPSSRHYPGRHCGAHGPGNLSRPLPSPAPTRWRWRSSGISGGGSSATPAQPHHGKRAARSRGADRLPPNANGRRGPQLLAPAVRRQARRLPQSGNPALVQGGAGGRVSGAVRGVLRNSARANGVPGAGPDAGGVPGVVRPHADAPGQARRRRRGAGRFGAHGQRGRHGAVAEPRARSRRSAATPRGKSSSRPRAAWPATR